MLAIPRHQFVDFRYQIVHGSGDCLGKVQALPLQLPYGVLRSAASPGSVGSSVGNWSFVASSYHDQTIGRPLFMPMELPVISKNASPAPDRHQAA